MKIFSKSKENKPAPTKQWGKSNFSNSGSFFQSGKPFFSPSTIQPKLTIGAPDDVYEKEADLMADQVVSKTAPVIQKKCAGCEEEEKVQSQPLEEEEEMLQMKPEEEEEMLQMKSDNSGAVSGTQSLQQSLGQSKGKGVSLPDPVLKNMNQAFGQSFDEVKIHTDSEAIRMNQAVSARAFTHNTDVYFNKGNYNPGTTSGKRLLAHELTHVVQQSGSKKEYIKPAENSIQRDFILQPPNPNAVPRELSDAEVSSALHYNLNRFANQEELRLVRDVLGLPPDAEHLIDRAFVIAVARWQAVHSLDQDGKLGRDSIRPLVAEYRAEGLGGEASRLNIRTRSDERSNNVDVNGKNDLFDAVLSHRNAQLTLNMKVNFVFQAPAGTTALTDAEQQNFIRSFRRDVRGVWAEQYALVPTGRTPANYLDTYYADINISSVNAGQHYSVYATPTVGGYVNTTSPGMGAGGPAANTGLHEMRMGTGDLGVYRGTSRGGHAMTQRTTAHEFGHMIGLDHVNCDRNDVACYGTTDRQRANIMGLGNRVDTGDYAPFVAGMNAITGSTWRAQ